jgi:energy-coupling factor transporter ATP-binding protein EcfA2
VARRADSDDGDSPTRGSSTNPEQSSELLEALGRFLRGTKTSEYMPPSLGNSLHVSTGLEEAILSELAAGRHVVLAGSAGSGKTHLLNRLRSQIGDTSAGRNDNDSGQYVKFIQDATELMDGGEEEAGLLELFASAKQQVSLVVAINQGVLLALARAGGDKWSSVRDILHAAQKGRISETRPDMPLVVDVEGLSPANSGSVSKLLQHPLFNEFVNLRQCGCYAECYRAEAWALLSSPTVLSRMDKLVEIAESNFGVIQWRDIWQFAQDLLIGGECSSEIPTSPWFYQAFHGQSRVSQAIRETIRLEHLVFPTLDSAIWHADWLRVADSIESESTFIPLPPDITENIDAFLWMKAQLYFSSHAAADALQTSVGLVNPRIRDAVRGNRPRAIIKGINTFLSYEHNRETAGELILWTDFGVARLTKRPTGQVSLGRVSTEELQVVASRVIANPSGESSSAVHVGSSRFLLHESSGAALPLENWLLRLLNERRSPLQSRRDHTELEWHVRKFFASIAESLPRSDKIEVMHVAFQTLRTTSRSYTLSGGLLERIPDNG